MKPIRSSVVLLEIEPEKQKTRIDFACSKTVLGVWPVCLTSIRKRGRQLFYQRDGREIRIERIYNRVIFDELLRRPELKPGFDFRDDLDVDMGRPPQLVFPDQQTFPAVPENGAYFAGLFCRRISARPSH